jgi:hypothetical protein
MNSRKFIIDLSQLFPLLLCLLICCNNSIENQNGNTGNQPLTLTLVTPGNNAADVDTSINLSWIGSDIDNDTLTYDIKIYLLDSVIESVNGITAQSTLITGLNYWTHYKWEVIATDGKDSISRSFYFNTRHKDVTFSTYVGSWKTIGYIDSVASYELVLELASDYSFRYNQNKITDTSTVFSYNGTWSVNATNSNLSFKIQNIADNSEYYLRFSGQQNEFMLLQHTDGQDMFHGIFGTEWCFTKQ